MFQDDFHFFSFVVTAVLAVDAVAIFVFLQASVWSPVPGTAPPFIGATGMVAISIGMGYYGWPAWGRDQEVVVNLNQAQVDAVEHLLMAFLKHSENAQIVAKVYEDAYASIMGSEGPAGIEEKEAALEHLNNLRLQLK